MGSGAIRGQVISPEFLVACYLLFIEHIIFFSKALCHDLVTFPSREELGQRSFGTEIYQGRGAGIHWASGFLPCCSCVAPEFELTHIIKKYFIMTSVN